MSSTTETCPICGETCETTTIKYYGGVMELSDCCNEEVDDE